MSFFSNLVPTELFKGLNLTGAYFWRFQKKETVQYPERRLPPKDRFRGMFGYSEERCIACGLCAKACPINIIYIADHSEKDPDTGKKRKVVDRYDIDLKRCMFCGLCEQACPTTPKAIWLTTKTYETATYERNEALYFTKDRLESWEGVLAYDDKTNRVVPPNQGQDPSDPFTTLAPPELKPDAAEAKEE